MCRIFWLFVQVPAQSCICCSVNPVTWQLEREDDAIRIQSDLKRIADDDLCIRLLEKELRTLKAKTAQAVRAASEAKQKLEASVPAKPDACGTESLACFLKRLHLSAHLAALQDEELEDVASGTRFDVPSAKSELMLQAYVSG